MKSIILQIKSMANTVKKLIKTVMLFVLFSLLFFGVPAVYIMRDSLIVEAREYIANKWGVVKVIETIVTPEEIETRDLIVRTAEEMEVPPALVLAIVYQESGQHLSPDRMRYEPHLLKRFKRLAHQTDIEYQANATSFGLMQVIYGLHKKTCNLKSYADLFDRKTNLRCGITILKNCLERQSARLQKVERVKQSLICYNGAEKYALEVFAKLGEIVIENM